MYMQKAACACVLSTYLPLYHCYYYHFIIHIFIQTSEACVNSYRLWPTFAMSNAIPFCNPRLMLNEKCKTIEHNVYTSKKVTAREGVGVFEEKPALLCIIYEHGYEKIWRGSLKTVRCSDKPWIACGGGHFTWWSILYIVFFSLSPSPFFERWPRDAFYKQNVCAVRVCRRHINSTNSEQTKVYTNIPNIPQTTLPLFGPFASLDSELMSKLWNSINLVYFEYRRFLRSCMRQYFPSISPAFSFFAQFFAAPNFKISANWIWLD